MVTQTLVAQGRPHAPGPRRTSGSPRLDYGRQAALDAQRAVHDEVGYEPIAQVRAEASREDREQQVALKQREVVADADSRAGCEGMVGVPVTGDLGILCPPIGVEAVGI